MTSKSSYTGRVVIVNDQKIRNHSEVCLLSISERGEACLGLINANIKFDFANKHCLAIVLDKQKHETTAIWNTLYIMFTLTSLVLLTFLYHGETSSSLFSVHSSFSFINLRVLTKFHLIQIR